MGAHGNLYLFQHTGSDWFVKLNIHLDPNTEENLVTLEEIKKWRILVKPS